MDRGHISKFVMIISGLLLISCLLPGMIPLNREPAGPMPTMEKNADKVIEALNGKNYVPLEALAQEQYTEQDFAKPGILTYTIKITDNKSTYFSYGWCAVDKKTLQQNFEHINVSLYFNDNELSKDVVHPLAFTRSDGLVCNDFGVLMSDWPAGEYKLKTVATFNDKINDGMADYAAGDYVVEYNVTVQK
ncbi:MAG TPA: hypothetical protein VF896_12575 [Anaerolineales bacterium]